MVTTPRISIIVPSYNSERTIRRCIDSILQQSFCDFELLLIDDGSIDNSKSIYEEYSHKDGRIKVICKKNGGVSSARNLGLEAARGEWVTFIDADDYIASDFFSAIERQTSDLVIGQCLHFNSFGKYWISENIASQEIRNNEKMQEFLTQYLLFHIMRTPWGKFFRKNLIGSNRFDEDMKLGEDTVFVHKYILGCNSIAVVSNMTYYYFDNDENVRIKYAMSPKDSLDHLKKIIKQYQQLNAKNPKFELFMFRFYLSLCLNQMKDNSNLWFGDNFITKLLISFRTEISKKDFLKYILMRIPWCYNWLMRDCYSKKNTNK